MLLSELKKRRKLVLLDNGKIQFVLYPSNKEETQKIEEYKELGLIPFGEGVEIPFDFIDQVNMCGHKSEVLSIHCKDIIPLHKKHKEIIVHERGATGVNYIDEYKCYQEHKYGGTINNIIKHEDKASSFKCACELMNVEYFIVLKEVISLQGKVDTIITTNDIKEVFTDIMNNGNNS